MAVPEINFTYLSGPDIDALAMTDGEILDAVEAGLRAQGQGQTVIEPRVHLEPDPAFHGHFNVLRGYIAPLGVAGDRPGRENDDETILFWHRGLSLSDIALGAAMLQKARHRGIGQQLRYA